MSYYKASVVIPTKNPGIIFIEVINKVMNQKTDFEFEILVVDSGSKDGTLEYMKQFDHLQSFSYIKIAPESFGHGKTRNFGAEQTSGEYIVFLTHDALPVNNQWLSEIVNIADSNIKIAGVFGRHIAYPTENEFVKRELELHFSGFIESPIVSLDDLNRYETDLGYKQYLHFFSDNNSLLRRSVWEEYPFPDVNFAEDQQWAKMIIENGFMKGYAHEAVVFHSHHYSLMERLRRSFDESLAFKNYFSYDLCIDMTTLWKNWKYLNERDCKYCLDESVWKRSFIDSLKQPFDNFMRLFGQYLGNNSDVLHEYFQNLISRDKRLFKDNK